MNTYIKYLLLFSSGSLGAEPNPPTWDDKHVLIFDPSDDPSAAQARVDAVWHENGGRSDSGNHG